MGMKPVWRAWLCAAAVAAGGCSTWRARPDVLRPDLGEREQVRIWKGGEVWRVHGVRVVGDSVLAVPYWKPPACDSCALRFPREAVDSVQVLVPDTRRSIVAAVITTVIVVPLLYWMGQLAGMKD